MGYGGKRAGNGPEGDSGMTRSCSRLVAARHDIQHAACVCMPPGRCAGPRPLPFPSCVVKLGEHPSGLVQLFCHFVPADASERALAAELRGIGVGVQEIPEWKKQVGWGCGCRGAACSEPSSWQLLRPRPWQLLRPRSSPPGLLAPSVRSVCLQMNPRHYPARMCPSSSCPAGVPPRAGAGQGSHVWHPGHAVHKGPTREPAHLQAAGAAGPGGTGQPGRDGRHGDSVSACVCRVAVCKRGWGMGGMHPCSALAAACLLAGPLRSPQPPLWSHIANPREPCSGQLLQSS